MKTEIRQTQTKGQGLYSLVHFEPNQVILTFNDKLLSKEEAYALPDSDSEMLLQIGKDKYLDLDGDVSYYINHSCLPNSMVKIMSNTAFLISTRHISPDEELTYDYSLTCSEDPSDWQMQCKCGEWNCRGMISGYPSLSDADKERYAKNAPKYVK